MRTTRHFLNYVAQGMKNFGEDMSTLINSFILLIVYAIGIGATSIITKLFRKKFLEISPSRKKDTYWSDIRSKNIGMENYYRQF